MRDRKIKLSWGLFLAAFIIAVLAGLGIRGLLGLVINLGMNAGSRNTILSILMISILGQLIKEYEILEKLVESILKVISSKKAVLIFIPALIGMLIIPGGAILSAPFVNRVGDEMEISKERRVAINLVFRHMATSLLPYSTSLLFISATVPGINIYKVILLNLIFVGQNFLIGYFLYIRNLKEEERLEREKVGKNLLKVALYTSPIYVPVIINFTTGLPFFISILSSFLILYFIGGKEEGFIVKSLGKINWDLVLTIVSIMLFKDAILNWKDLFILVDRLFASTNNNFLTMIFFFLVSLVFGLISGHSTVPLAVTLPIFLHMTTNADYFYPYIYFLYTSAFLGYFFSPIHLCQVLTLEEMGVRTKNLYKVYRPYVFMVFTLFLLSTAILFVLA